MLAELLQHAATAYDDPVTTYARDVIEGREVAGPYVRAACQRHLDDLGRTDLFFDTEAADRFFRYVRSRIRLSEGQFQGEPLELHASQKFITGSIFGWKRPPDDDPHAPVHRWVRRFRRVYIEQGKGNGKALALDTPIPTPDGWSTMGELNVGDTVFDENGKPTEVIGAFNTMHNHECYAVEFDDGEVIVADADHLWFTEQRSKGTREQGSMLRGLKRSEFGNWRKGIRTTKQIAETLTHRNGKHQSVNHSIPLVALTAQPDRQLPIHPYVLGAWLGDGDSDGARITCGDEDVQTITNIEKCGYSVGERKVVGHRTPRYRISELGTQLRSENLLGNKHIPSVYLRASFNQRLELLQGLMDTDGYISPRNGQCEFTSINKRLAWQVRELVHTLGLKSGLHAHHATINGRKVSQKYRVTFNPPHDLPVFQLSRKHDHQIERHNRRRLSADRRIVDCRHVQSVPVRCIRVAADSGLFLAGRSMVITHNTPVVAAIGLYGMEADREPGAEIYAAAASRVQADIMFQDAVKMAQASPELAKRITFGGNAKVFNMAMHGPRQAGSFFRPLARTAATAGSGKRPHFALLDELHEHPNGQMLDMLEAGFKWRRQPLLVMITNSGTDRKSICWREREHATAVALGDVEDDTTFSYVCALDATDDPFKDPSCWRKANPLLGVTITERYLQGVVDAARKIPGKANGILRLHFCVWTDSETAWIPRETWEQCEDPTLDIEDWIGRDCHAGLDLGSRKDMTGKALVFHDDYVEGKDGRMHPTFVAFAHGYTPEDTLEIREAEDRAHYREWCDKGFLTSTPGMVVRFPFIIRDLVDDQQRFNLKAVAYDQYLISRFKEEADDMGADLPLVEHPQGWVKRNKEVQNADGEVMKNPLWMPGSVEMLETLILEGRLRVHVNPALRSAVAGATFLTSSSELRRFAKEKATQRIDILVALTMAIGSATQEVEDHGLSVYDQIAKQRAEQQTDEPAPAPVLDDDDEDDDDW